MYKLFCFDNHAVESGRRSPTLSFTFALSSEEMTFYLVIMQLPKK